MSTTDATTDPEQDPREACDRCGFSGGIKTHSATTAFDRLCFPCATEVAADE